MNRLDYYAQRAINGDYGNGKDREEALGPLYGMVQNRVNEILGYPKRYPMNYNWEKYTSIIY